MIQRDIIKNKIVADLLPLHPEKIILFGSFLSDKFVEGKSDIDVLIIKDDAQEAPAQRYKEARLALTLPYPFDIFVLTREELQRKLRMSFFFNEIVKQGEVIYEQ